VTEKSPTLVSVPQVEPEQPGEPSLVPSPLSAQVTPAFVESFWTEALTLSDPPVATDATPGATDTVIVCAAAEPQNRVVISRSANLLGSILRYLGDFRFDLEQFWTFMFLSPLLGGPTHHYSEHEPRISCG
jgi:hypothetical protein